MTGAVLTGVYLFKRNLWITITAEKQAVPIIAFAHDVTVR